MHIEIFYINTKTGWGFAVYDQNEQIGDTVYCYHKNDAKTEAVKKAKEQSILLVKSFGRSGQQLASIFVN